MIQRIQSIWLFLAALMAAGLLYFKLYTYNSPKGIEEVYVSSGLGFLVLAIILIILPLVALFMFKNRKRQKGLAILNIIAAIGFIAATVMRVTSVKNDAPLSNSTSYGIGAVLPVAIIVFTALAINDIRKDEKLVKSLDRLR